MCKPSGKEVYTGIKMGGRDKGEMTLLGANLANPAELKCIRGQEECNFTAIFVYYFYLPPQIR